MQRRITFIGPREIVQDKAKYIPSRRILQVQGLEAAREDKIAVPATELKEELQSILESTRQFHIRWISGRPYPLKAPFQATAPPGLHVVFESTNDSSLPRICRFLRDTLKILSTTPDCNSFVSPIQSSSTNSAFYYFDRSSNAIGLTQFLQSLVCKDSLEQCRSELSHLSRASYIDLDLDSQSQPPSLVVNAYTLGAHLTKKGSWQDEWDVEITNCEGSFPTEVGILYQKSGSEARELSFQGFLLDFQKDNNLKPTLFSYSSRHLLASRRRDHVYRTHFIQPQGLHPTLQLKFPSAPVAPASNCVLNTYLILPSAIFIDKYSLSSPNFLASKNLAALKQIEGETDLEAPDWAIDRWGSSVSLELRSPASSYRGEWNVDIPLHLRYVQSEISKDGKAQHNIALPWPAVYWACNSNLSAERLDTNPFDRRDLGFDRLFNESTQFYHVQPMENATALTETIKFSSLDMDQSMWVENGTAVVILAGFFTLCWSLAQPYYAKSKNSAISLKEKNG